MQLGLCVSDWTLGNPLCNAVNFQDSLNNLLQAGIAVGDVAFHHVVQVVQNACEVNVGPGQLSEG